MKINKPQRISLVEQVIKEMEQMIHKGYWEVGDRIPSEKELMEQFGVSRNTLREALRALAHLGLLKTKQGSGTYIKSASMFGAVVTKHIEQSNILQILEVRLAIEHKAAYLAAERRTQKELDKMKRLIDICQEALDQGNLHCFLKADVALHETIVEASQNNLLIDLYASINDSLQYSIEQIVVHHEGSSDEKLIHRELYLAIKNKAPKTAGELVKKYITTWKNIVENPMEE